MSRVTPNSSSRISRNAAQDRRSRQPEVSVSKRKPRSVWRFVDGSLTVERTGRNANRLCRQARKVLANTTKRIAVFGMAVTLVILAGLDAWASPAEAVLRIRKHTDSSDELFYIVYVADDCRVGHDDVISTVEGVLIRSRVTPIQGMDNIYLVIDLNCLEREALNPIFNLNVRYVVILDGEHWEMWWDYGTFGLGSSDFIRGAIKDSVERAVTDLIRAHGP